MATPGAEADSLTERFVVDMNENKKNGQKSNIFTGTDIFQKFRR
jgi:hypothetical protein